MLVAWTHYYPQKGQNNHFTTHTEQGQSIYH